jgi:hypothetical protein
MIYLDFPVSLDGQFSSEHYATRVYPQICNIRFPVINNTVMLRYMCPRDISFSPGAIPTKSRDGSVAAACPRLSQLKPIRRHNSQDHTGGREETYSQREVL